VEFWVDALRKKVADSIPYGVTNFTLT